MTSLKGDGPAGRDEPGGEPTPRFDDGWLARVAAMPPKDRLVDGVDGVVLRNLAREILDLRAEVKQARKAERIALWAARESNAGWARAIALIEARAGADADDLAGPVALIRIFNTGTRSEWRECRVCGGASTTSAPHEIDHDDACPVPAVFAALRAHREAR